MTQEQRKIAYDREATPEERRAAGRELAEILRAAGEWVGWDPDCTYCAEYLPGDFYPRHDASSRCQSGKHTHCTCDTCF